MAKLGISTGSSPNAGNGDSLFQGAQKINSNFNEIYSAYGDGTNLRIFWNYNTVGINTLDSVGIGTTNPTSKLTVRNGDISVGINTSNGVILTSPNGTKYRLFVNNSGALSTVLVP